MRLLSLEVTNYRNIASARLEPGRELTVICGNNGQGKTNLLEAIWLLTGGKSFRGGKDAELVRRGETFAVLEAVTQRTRQEDQEPDDPARVRITVGTPDAPPPRPLCLGERGCPQAGGRSGRQLSRCGVRPRTPEPGQGRTGGPPPVSGRGIVPAVPRVSGYLPPLRPGIAAEKMRCCGILPPGRSALMRKKCALLEVLNVELAAQGEVLQQRRRDYLALLGPLACANYQELSHGAERMSIRYAAQFAPGGLADLLKQRQNEELRAGQSLCGVHREDLELLLDDQPARVFASQGQQRSVVLSLKMAEAAAAARITGEHPVLLLDDVLSELDEGRKQYLLTRMKEKQTFVTSCDDTAFLKTDGEVYRMNGGVLSRA